MKTELNEPAIAYLKTTDWQTQILSGTDLIAVSRYGISANQLATLQSSTGLENNIFAKILQVTTRTLQNKTGNIKLGVAVSEKALKLSRLYLKGYHTFGDKDNFKTWMRSPVLALNNNTPLSYLDTQFGFELVEQMIGRISHGVIS